MEEQDLTTKTTTNDSNDSNQLDLKKIMDELLDLKRQNEELRKNYLGNYNKEYKPIDHFGDNLKESEILKKQADIAAQIEREKAELAEDFEDVIKILSPSIEFNVGKEKSRNYIKELRNVFYSHNTNELDRKKNMILAMDYYITGSTENQEKIKNIEHKDINGFLKAYSDNFYFVHKNREDGVKKIEQMKIKNENDYPSSSYIKMAREYQEEKFNRSR